MLGNSMNINNYLINQKGLDWSNILSTWNWLLPPKFAIWLVNRFGDLFFVLDGETIHMLDVGNGTLKQVTVNREEFSQKIDELEQANDWLMIPLVDKLVASGQVLKVGQCYSYRQLPALGGDYTTDNTVIKDIAFHYAAFGPIHQSIKDLPDGTQVTFE
jgi:hypothetical protein